MKVNNLYIVNTKLITEVMNYSNFNRHVKYINNGYKIVEKKKERSIYNGRRQKVYLIPGTAEAIPAYFVGQNEGDIYREKKTLRLSKYCDKEELSIAEIEQLEKEINEKGLVKKKEKIDMKVIQVKTGYLEENCYLLIKEDNCLIIDPGDDFPLIKEQIKSLHVIGILITHNHFDHIGAKEEIIKEYKVDFYDKTNLKEGIFNIENFSFEVIYNPGHSKDSISFYFEEENSIFVGDFLFENSIGRCDLPTGDFNKMKESLNKFKNRFKNYKDLNIYSGHGNKTTLEQELKYNIYFE